MHNRRNSYLRLIAVVTVFLLISTGLAYRLVAPRFQDFLNNPINLPQPLSEIPINVNDWVGKDIEIPILTRQYMEENFANDHISRVYVNNTTKQMANVYVVYCASQPSRILGHRPRVCYVAGGWNYLETNVTQLALSNYQNISCNIHHFRNPNPSIDDVYVLNFYILNGQTTLEESGFASIWGRRPNIAGDPAYYVAQVQISSSTPFAVLSASQELVQPILEFFPKTVAEKLPQ